MSEPRLVRFEAALWQTASLLLLDGPRAVLVDPGIDGGEVAAIAAAVAAAGATVTHVLITHADWDHVAGVSSFPRARVLASAAEAERIDRGEAAWRLANAARTGGISVAQGWPRVDGILRPGRRVRLGRLTVEPLLLSGHTAGGLAFRVPELGVLAVGDHLSAIEFPFAGHSPAAYRASLAALCDLLRRDPPAKVVPGHGPPLDAGQALAIAEADLAYLRALRAAAEHSLASQQTRPDAIAAAYAVDPPRFASDDLADERQRNAERQVDELLACAA